MRPDRRFYRSEVDEEELELSLCDLWVENRVAPEGEDDKEELFDFRRFYRSGIGDLAKRPPALIRFWSRTSFSR